jgi:hypothetical protein
MTPDPDEQQTREVTALGPGPVDDDAPTPRRGTPIARITRKLDRTNWKGAVFVLITLVLTLALLVLFFSIKALSP